MRKRRSHRREMYLCFCGLDDFIGQRVTHSGLASVSRDSVDYATQYLWQIVANQKHQKRHNDENYTDLKMAFIGHLIAPL
jgi:hypothetical protein